MADSSGISSSTQTVLILFFCLIGLIVLLIFLYKKLNKEADGEYTIRRIVYKEGGIRDRMRAAALTVGTRLGVQLWPHSDTDEDGEEMQEVQDEEGDLEDGSSQGSDSEAEAEEDDVQTREEESKSSDSSSEGSEAGEETKLTDRPEANGKVGEKGEEKEENTGYGEGATSAGAGLFVDLKQFSGSAIWSGEEGGEAGYCDVTPL